MIPGQGGPRHHGDNCEWDPFTGEVVCEDANSHPHPHAYSHLDSQADQDTHSNSDSNSLPNTHQDFDAHSDGNSLANAHQDFDPDPDGNSLANADAQDGESALAGRQWVADRVEDHDQARWRRVDADNGNLEPKGHRRQSRHTRRRQRRAVQKQQLHAKADTEHR